MSSKLDPEAKPSPGETSFRGEKYLVFGEKGEYFGAHIIEGKPNFDAILKMSEPQFLGCGGSCRNSESNQAPDSINFELPVILSSSHGIKLPKIYSWIGIGLKSLVLDHLYVEEDELSH